MDPAILRQIQPAPVLATLGACFLLWLVGMQVLIELAAPVALIGSAVLGALAHQGQMPPWGPTALQSGASLLLYRLLFVRRPAATQKGKVDPVPSRTFGGLQLGRTLLDLLTFWMPRGLKDRLGFGSEQAGATIYSNYRR